MKDTTRYAKIVEWSDIDQCYIGRIPGLMHGGCNGDDEQAVFAELCVIAEEIVAIFHADNRPLPPPTIDGQLPKVLQEWAGMYVTKEDVARHDAEEEAKRKRA